jgi:hypothetical protein
VKKKERGGKMEYQMFTDYVYIQMIYPEAAQHACIYRYLLHMCHGVLKSKANEMAWGRDGAMTRDYTSRK